VFLLARPFPEEAETAVVFPAPGVDMAAEVGCLAGEEARGVSSSLEDSA